MRTKALIFPLLVTLLTLWAVPVHAQEVPPMPHSFFSTEGGLTINGAPAPIGTEVKAVCSGVQYGDFDAGHNPIITTEVGRYGDSEPTGTKLMVQGNISAGATIRFYINGVDTGQTYSFTEGATTVLNLSATIVVTAPTVTTSAAASVATNSATLNGNLSSLGTASSVTVSFEWETTTSYGSETAAQTMTATGSFSAALSGLTPGTTYHFRTKTVGEGTSYGSDMSFTTASTSGGGGGGGGVTSLTGKVSTQGKTTQSLDAQSADDVCHLTIATDVEALDKGGNPLSQIIIVSVSAPPLPEDTSIIGLTYDLGPSGAIFSPPITLELSYDQSDIPTGVNEEDLVIKYYDEDAADWVDVLESTVNTATNTITASISHFTAFAILGEGEAEPSTPSAPASFSFSSLKISPTEANIGETVNISILIANSGGQSANCSVTLKVGGNVEAITNVTVAAGASKQVSFSTTKDVTGTYSVDVSGLTGSFTVKEATPATPPAPPAPPTPSAQPPPNWPVLGGIIAGVVVVALLIFLLARRRAY